MPPRAGPTGRAKTGSLFARWVRATAAGWLLGIVFVIALALLGEAVGIAGSQALVGAGMGLGIGLTQSRVLRGLLPRPAAWVRACAIGLTAPFLVIDIASATGKPLPYALPVAVAAGGLVAGIWQARILRASGGHAAAWLVANTVGWALAAGTTAAADMLFRSRSLRGVLGALAYLAVVAAGGPILGATTGACLAWMVRREAVKIADGRDSAPLEL